MKTGTVNHSKAYETLFCDESMPPQLAITIPTTT